MYLKILLQRAVMPRQRKYTIPGVMGRDPHPYHRHWEFSYMQEGADRLVEQSLVNDDLEMCPKKIALCGLRWFKFN